MPGMWSGVWAMAPPGHVSARLPLSLVPVRNAEPQAPGPTGSASAFHKSLRICADCSVRRAATVRLANSRLHPDQ